MPEVLGLEPLAARDSAWREAQDGSEASRGALKLAASNSADAVTRSVGPHTTPIAGAPAPAAESQPRSRSWVWLVLAAAILLSAGLLVVFLRPQNGLPPAPIIVEKQSVIEDAPPASAASPGSPAATTFGTSAASSATSASRQATPKASAAGTRRTLAGAFQQRQGAIQGCFKQNPAALVDSQHLSVRFDVDSSGRVVKASLSPASVASQPLGSCILGVARTTNFGSQAEAISFSIPIAARMVEH
jgi:hypothetical protein